MHCDPQCPHLAVLVDQVGQTPQTPTKNKRGGSGDREGVLKDSALESKTTRVPKARNPRAPLQNQTRTLSTGALNGGRVYVQSPCHSDLPS